MDSYGRLAVLDSYENHGHGKKSEHDEDPIRHSFVQGASGTMSQHGIFDSRILGVSGPRTMKFTELLAQITP
jgi:hypothetical protein